MRRLRWFMPKSFKVIQLSKWGLETCLARPPWWNFKTKLFRSFVLRLCLYFCRLLHIQIWKLGAEIYTKLSTVILTFQIYKIFIFVKIKAIKKYTCHSRYLVGHCNGCIKLKEKNHCRYVRVKKHFYILYSVLSINRFDN